MTIFMYYIDVMISRVQSQKLTVFAIESSSLDKAGQLWLTRDGFRLVISFEIARKEYQNLILDFMQLWTKTEPNDTSQPLQWKTC